MNIQIYLKLDVWKNMKDTSTVPDEYIMEGFLPGHVGQSWNRKLQGLLGQRTCLLPLLAAKDSVTQLQLWEPWEEGGKKQQKMLFLGCYQQGFLASLINRN